MEKENDERIEQKDCEEKLKGIQMMNKSSEVSSKDAIARVMLEEVTSL